MNIIGTVLQSGFPRQPPAFLLPNFSEHGDDPQPQTRGCAHHYTVRYTSDRNKIKTARYTFISQPYWTFTN